MTVYRWGKYNVTSREIRIPHKEEIVSGNCELYPELNTSITDYGLHSGGSYRVDYYGHDEGADYKCTINNYGGKYILEIVEIETTYVDFAYVRGRLTKTSYSTETVKEKGNKVGTVTSANRNSYPNDGESGSYWYVYEGIANQTPSISGQDEDLGGFKAPFKRAFSVNDPDNNETLNVIVKLNSATIRTINNATKGESYEIDIDKTKFDELELNKTNTIEITVSDSNGASAIRRYTFKKVNSNPVVTVTNSNMGEQNKPFSFNFNANDPDGDEITVKVYIDDVQIKDLGQVTKNQDIQVTIDKLDYAKLQNGKHKIKIEAIDSYNAKGIGYIDFSKSINYCWYRLTKEVDAQPSAIVTNVLAELAAGANMTVKVSLNAKDTSPTWEVVPDELIGQKYNFKTKTKTADKWCIGVDIRIDRADTPEGKTSYFYGFVGAYM
ncbi:hypothetical protein [Peptoniphilus sp.]|uniref:hypothetical protein n=1 Tax=Peptoniphilus sp. TaxID=1971214 RepID=UPI002A804C03|nr:hypothetical protein [Peptoniphilus sp.]MDY3903014.1 hypothetical protein [Peptoniphilus sp.]